MTNVSILDDGVTVTDYGCGYVSYEIEFDDAPAWGTGNKIRVIFDETRALTIMGDSVSLVPKDILRLRNFLDTYTILPDLRK